MTIYISSLSVYDVEVMAIKLNVYISGGRDDTIILGSDVKVSPGNSAVGRASSGPARWKGMGKKLRKLPVNSHSNHESKIHTTLSYFEI